MEDSAEERFSEAWKSQWEEDKYCRARVGDHLLTPFECDRCIFWRLAGRNPSLSSDQDKLLLACIRRANLDSLWSRSSQTVYQNMRKVIQSLEFSATLGLDGAYLIHNPTPFYDYAGYEIAYSILLHSRRPGKHSKNYTQFATIRKHRSAFSNFMRAYPSRNFRNLAFEGMDGAYKGIADEPCALIRFQKFIVGCGDRMG